VAARRHGGRAAPRRTPTVLKGGLADAADLAKKRFSACNFQYCFMYDFSVALICALALFKLIRQFKTKGECSKNRLELSPRGVVYGLSITSLHFVVLHTFL